MCCDIYDHALPRGIRALHLRSCGDLIVDCFRSYRVPSCWLCWVGRTPSDPFAWLADATAWRVERGVIGPVESSSSQGPTPRRAPSLRAVAHRAPSGRGHSWELSARHPWPY